MVASRETKIIRIEPGKRTGDIVYVDDRNRRWEKVDNFDLCRTGDHTAFTDGKRIYKT